MKLINSEGSLIKWGFVFVFVLLPPMTGTACTTSVDSPALEWGEKSFSEQTLPLQEQPLLSFPCNLESCSYKVTVKASDVPRGLVLTYGTEPEVFNEIEGIPVETSRKRLFENDSFESWGYVYVPRGEHFGFLSNPGADLPEEALVTIEHLLRSRDGFLLPADSSGRTDFAVDHVLDEEVHRWTIPVTDRFNFRNPNVLLTLSSGSDSIEMVGYFLCGHYGTSENIPLVHGEAASPGESYLSLIPNCSGANDAGDVYIEVSGSGAYSLTAEIR